MKTSVKETQEKIAQELDQISRYVSGFEALSARDGQALADILSMLASVNAAIVKIEESHQKRIHLAKELAKSLAEMEDGVRQFAEKHGKDDAE